MEPHSEPQYIEIPRDLNSVDFLRFVGLNSATANAIWESWNDQEDPLIQLIDVALNYVKGFVDLLYHSACSCSAIDTNIALRQVGMSLKSCVRFIDSDSKWVHFGDGPSSLPVDILNSNYKLLLSISDRIVRKHQKISQCFDDVVSLEGHKKLDEMVGNIESANLRIHMDLQK